MVGCGSPKVVGRGAAHNLNVSERGEAAGHLGEVDHVVAPLDELVREVEYQLVLHRPRQRVFLVLPGQQWNVCKAAELLSRD